MNREAPRHAMLPRWPAERVVIRAIPIARQPYKGTGPGPGSANPDANRDRGQKPTCERRCRRPKSLRHAGPKPARMRPRY
jgi:hypothetical protein